MYVTGNFSPTNMASQQLGGVRIPTPPRRHNPQKQLHRFLTLSFYKLGVTIAQFPSYFIIVPVFLSLLGLTGFQTMYLEENVETLFYPDSGSAPSERAVIEEYFPLNFTQFLPYHLTRLKGFSRVLIQAKDNGTIFRKEIWDEIMILDEAIRNFKIIHEDKAYDYSNLCARYGGECSGNTVLELYSDIDAIANGSMQINYPIMVFPLVLPMFFGGITLDPSGMYIASAKALNLNYFLQRNSKEEQERDLTWEKEFISFVGEMKFDHLHISRYTARSIQDLTKENPEMVKPYIPYIMIMMVVFSVGNTVMGDWVRSKFYLGLVGLFSAGMGTVSAFGFLMYMGVPNTGMNNIIPFIMIGIGLDDMFVVLSAWRRTRLQDNVTRRMGLTYADAGVSITITSLTNAVSFSIGVLTPILAVRLFCLYTAFSVIMSYLWNLFFFGGCLAISGKLEKDQRHSIVCTRVKAKSEAEGQMSCSYLWCYGGLNPKDPWNPKDNEHHAVMLFFKNYFGKMLTMKYVKGAVLALFLAYLLGAMYGCAFVKEGLDRRNIVRQDSYIVDYFNMEDRLFRQHPYQIQVVITGNVTYSDKETRKRILSLHKRFESLPYISNGILTVSWMRSWFIRMRRTKLEPNITSESTFISFLRERYLNGKGGSKALDLAFNEDYSRIVASRFILQTNEIRDTNEDKNMMLELRRIAKEAPFNVTVFNPNFIFFDQYMIVRPVIIQSILVAALAMIIISLIFIPNPWCCLHVGFTIVSIEIGVIGYMALWNVSLDPISMVTLIMCIGFSVDFSAHISYAYLTSKAKKPDEKIRECLFSLGLPIVQGALSTIISIISFVFIPSYAYITFYKVIFLVVFFAGLHGLFLLPVLLSIAGPDTVIRFFAKKSYLKDKIRSPSASSTESDPKEKRPSNTLIETTKDNGVVIENCAYDGIIPPKQERDDPEGCSNEGFSIESEDSQTNKTTSKEKC